MSGAVRVALVGPEIEENLGLRYLASSLARAGWAADIVPFNSGRDLPWALEAILHGEVPGLVALSLAFQWRAADVLALAVALREHGYEGHLTAGGHFGTFECEAVLRDFPELDSVCRFEAERSLPQLVEAVRAGRDLGCVAGLAYRRDGGIALNPPGAPPDLAELPWPDRRGEPTCCLGHGIAPLVASRGCYANCSFCCITAWHRAQSGQRFRMRPVSDVADEMAWLQRAHGTDIFVFHDDDFFVPGPARALERLHALADALEERGMSRFATVVKARPTDVTPETFRVMRDRLGLVRSFLGVENASAQGLRTLRRGVRREENQRAMGTLRDLGVYCCFNLLLFEPDTTLETLEENLAFLEEHADVPCNFGRVELYAGTPLLARMRAESRCRGDYMAWDYALAEEPAQRVFELAMRCFPARNFEAGALANRLMGTRFDVETARHFHADVYDPRWLEHARGLSRRLGRDSVEGTRALVRTVRQGDAAGAQDDLAAALSLRLRAVEREVEAGAASLEGEIRRAVGAGCRHARPRELLRSGT